MAGVDRPRNVLAALALSGTAAECRQMDDVRTYLLPAIAQTMGGHLAIHHQMSLTPDVQEFGVFWPDDPVIPAALSNYSHRRPAPRRRRRHQLATVLVVSVAAVVAGARTLASIAGWAADLPAWARPRLGIVRQPSSLSTIRRVLILVDAEVLDAVLHAGQQVAASPSGGSP